MDINYPWQATPTEMVRLAIDFFNRDTENERAIAFLLLDVGVETILKTFLLLPESVTKVTMSYNKRKEATESNFHNLIEAVKEAAKGRLDGIAISEVEYFHGVRNKLYHQGDGVIPTKQNTEKYAGLVVDLLDRLLLVDLRPHLMKKTNRQELLRQRRDLVNMRLEPIWNLLMEHINKIRKDLVIQLESIGSIFAQKSFTDEMETYINKLSDADGQQWKSGIRRLLFEGLFILDDDDIPIDCIMWDASDDKIIEYLKNICYESPAGPCPRLLLELNPFREGMEIIAEYDLVEILLSDDLTEALLLITNFIKNFSYKISVDEYRERRDFLKIDIYEIVADDDFEDNFNEILEKGKEIEHKILLLGGSE